MKDKKKNQSKANRMTVRGQGSLFKRREDPDFERYGYVIAMLGDGRARVHCDDGFVRVCRIRGAIRGRVHIAANDIVLVSLRDISSNYETLDGKRRVQNDVADLVYKYSLPEVKTLTDENEIIPGFGSKSQNPLDDAVDGGAGAAGSDTAEDPSINIVFDKI